MIEQAFAAGLGAALVGAIFDRLSRKGQIIAGAICAVLGLLTVAAATLMLIQ